MNLEKNMKNIFLHAIQAAAVTTMKENKLILPYHIANLTHSGLRCTG